jgi:hypothetical protein
MALRMVQRPSRLLSASEYGASEYGEPENGVPEADEADGPGVTPIRHARRARHARAKAGHGLSTLLRPA